MSGWIASVVRNLVSGQFPLTRFAHTFLLSLPVMGKLFSSKSLNSPITVGDKVTIFDCPGHWSWASPFTVEAILGEIVKLEMVEEWVEMGRLEKWSK